MSSPTFWRHHVEPDFADRARRFCADHVIPDADRIDREDVYPVELVSLAAEAGYTGLTLAERYGGGGRSSAHAACMMEELSYGSAALGISLITIFQSQTIIARYGTDSLKEAVLPRIVAGLRCSYALTESAHGSDIRQLDTRATRTAGGWSDQRRVVVRRLRLGGRAVRRAGPDRRGGQRVRRAPDADGISTYESRDAETFGLRNGPRVNLVLDEVTVAADHLIGVEGEGLRQAMFTLANSRTLAGAISLGVARAAFDGAASFAAGREAFGQPVLGFQGIQWYFAEAAARIDAARLLTYQAAADLDAGHDIARSTSEAKLLSCQVATEVAAMAVQVCGARGTMESAPFGRYLRDAKAYEIAGG